MAELASAFVDNFDEYDVITGPVLRGKKNASMDRYKDRAECFNEGDIAFEELRKNTRLSSEDFDQWCFKSKKAFDYINAKLSKRYIVRRRYDILEEFDFKAGKGGDG